MTENRALSFLLVVSLSLPACGFVAGVSEIEAAVERDAVAGQAAVIEEIAGASRDKDVILLGETHYLQEHQELVLELLKALHGAGVRCYGSETPHAYGPVIDAYIRHTIDSIPYEMRYMENHLIEGLRAYNGALPESTMIRYSSIDVNHWPEALGVAVSLLSALLPMPKALEELIDASGSPEYAALVRLALRSLEEESDRLVEAWGEAWYRTMLTMVEVEVTSVAFRARNDARSTEETMRRCVSRVVESQGTCVVNVGMFHAQKRRLLGTPRTWLRARLSADGYDVLSVAFFAMEGALKRKFSDTEPRPFNLHHLGRGNLTRILSESSGGLPTLLPLRAAVFTEKLMPVSFGTTRRIARPGRHFDMIVLYPSGHSLESMVEFPLAITP